MQNFKKRGERWRRAMEATQPVREPTKGEDGRHAFHRGEICYHVVMAYLDGAVGNDCTDLAMRRYRSAIQSLRDTGVYPSRMPEAYIRRVAHDAYIAIRDALE